MMRSISEEMPATTPAPAIHVDATRTTLRGVRLAVFMTRGMSLSRWEAIGIIQRELALYEQLRPFLDGIAMVSYGAATEEQRVAQRYPQVTVLPQRRPWGSNMYSLLSPWLHRKTLRTMSVFKAYQINGAWSAAFAKFLFRRPLIVRFGYLWSPFVEHLKQSWWRVGLTRFLERSVLRYADRVVAAGEADRDYVVRRYRVPHEKTRIIPNYVDLETFRPMPEVTKEPGLICVVARLVPHKNLEQVVHAVRELPAVRLAIIGDGPLRDSLERAAQSAGSRVEFLGRVSHAELPVALNRAQVYVQSSTYEGNTKTVLEAMACGLPMIGAQTPGIRDQLRHGETGYLCAPTAAGFRAAIQTVLADHALRKRMGEAARAEVVAYHSFEQSLKHELELLRELYQEQVARIQGGR